MATERGGRMSDVLRNRPLLTLMLGHYTVDMYVGVLPVLYPVLTGRFSLDLKTVGLLSLAYSGMASLALPDKSFYFVGGLTEATETIGCFALMCLWPAAFAHLAYGFAALCALTALARVWWGWRAFAPGRKESTEPVSRRE